jgi:hypothetical protein
MKCFVGYCNCCFWYFHLNFLYGKSGRSKGKRKEGASSPSLDSGCDGDRRKVKRKSNANVSPSVNCIAARTRRAPWRLASKSPLSRANNVDKSSGGSADNPVVVDDDPFEPVEGARKRHKVSEKVSMVFVKLFRCLF